MSKIWDEQEWILPGNWNASKGENGEWTWEQHEGPYRAALKCDACLYAGHMISLEPKTVLTETEAHKSTRQSGEWVRATQCVNINTLTVLVYN